MSGVTLGCFSIGFNIGDLPAWFQALGSVGAVAVAIWVSSRQSKTSEQLAVRQHQESLELLAEQDRQTVSRETAAYHRSIADRLVPITALIEHWYDIVIHAIDVSSQGQVHVQDEKTRGRIRGLEATQLDDAIKRVDVQAIPEIHLVNDFIKMRHLSKLMAGHVLCLKSKGASQEALNKAAKALNYDLPKVAEIRDRFSKSRDGHLMKAGLYFDT